MGTTEIWKAIAGYPDHEVSDMGNVRRVKINLKLTLEDVAECRKLRKQGLLYREIAERFNVTYVAVRVALTYKPKRRALREPYRLLKTSLRSGYRFVGLCKQGVATIYAVHRLVMEAFVGPCPAGKEVNHKNGIRSDPRLVNLEYVTHSENLLYHWRVTMRGKKRKMTPKTHCKRGHKFTPANTFVRLNGERSCKACQPKAYSGYRQRGSGKWKKPS